MISFNIKFQSSENYWTFRKEKNVAHVGWEEIKNSIFFAIK